jgi:hypothetical protein
MIHSPNISSLKPSRISPILPGIKILSTLSKVLDLEGKKENLKGKS